MPLSDRLLVLHDDLGIRDRRLHRHPADARERRDAEGVDVALGRGQSVDGGARAGRRRPRLDAALWEPTFVASEARSARLVIPSPRSTRRPRGTRRRSRRSSACVCPAGPSGSRSLSTTRGERLGPTPGEEAAMSTQHMDRLSAIDASFLAQERDGSHMHIGARDAVRGAAAQRARSSRSTSSRACTSCPATARSSRVPAASRWAARCGSTTRDFNLDYHVRHTALPAPGGDRAAAAARRADLLAAPRPLEAALGALAGRGPRRRPLRDHQQDPPLRSSTASRASTSPRSCSTSSASRAAVEPPSEWTPGPSPPTRSGRAGGSRDLAGTPFGLARRAIGALAQPVERAWTRRARPLEGVGEVAWGGSTPPPETPLNVPIGPHRRVTWVRADLADLKEIKNALGGTVNDVFLAVVTGALARWLRARGVRTEGLELRGAVPVSVRADGRAGRARQPDHDHGRAAADLRRRPGRAPPDRHARR